MQLVWSAMPQTCGGLILNFGSVDSRITPCSPSSLLCRCCCFYTPHSWMTCPTYLPGANELEWVFGRSRTNAVRGRDSRTSLRIITGKCVCLFIPHLQTANLVRKLAVPASTKLKIMQCRQLKLWLCLTGHTTCILIVHLQASNSVSRQRLH